MKFDRMMSEQFLSMYREGATKEKEKKEEIEKHVEALYFIQCCQMETNII